MRFVLPSYAVFFACFLSGVLIFIESVAYNSNSVWHGNVTVTGIGHDSSGTPTLDFLYSGKHGYTGNTEAIIRFSQNTLPYLWCDVSRTGLGSCFPPPLQKIKAEK